MFAAASASAATYVPKTGAVGLYAGSGTGKLLSSHADLAACAAAAAMLAKVATYTCKASVAVTVVAPPPAPAPAPVPAPPPPPPAPAPVPAPPPPAPAPVPAPPPPAPAPAPAPIALPTDGYTLCAQEGQQCMIAGPSDVIYGAGKTFSAPKTFVTSPWCNNGAFTDPAYGVVKQCWSKLSAATGTDTTPSDMTSAMPFVDMSKVPTERAVGTGEFKVMPTTEEPALSDSGAFRTSCTQAFMAKIDPIVVPGTVGKSHLHTFFGNVNTTENSTTASLLGYGNSTCRGGIANRSAYWVPTMIDTATGAPVIPDDIGVYYKSGEFTGDMLTQGIPEGLRMIAGNPMSDGPPKPGDPFAYRYKCIGGPRNQNDHYGSEIPNCDLGASVWQEIFFPQCWDGVNLDSPDHKSHMSYTALVPDPASTQGWFKRVCPASHPVIIPHISFNVVYTAKTLDAALKWRLASDMYDPTKPGGYSAHGDWFNGWRKDISEAWFKNCLVAKKDCHSHLLGDGRMIF
jgi:hypothetical protein